jgi:hypothetical protein
MRKIIMAFLFCLHSVANAQAFQYMHPSLCDKLETVLESITQKFDEKPVWTGQDAGDGSKFMLFENTKQNTWTLIKYNRQVACVMGVGTDSKSFFGTPV